MSSIIIRTFLDYCKKFWLFICINIHHKTRILANTLLAVKIFSTLSVFYLFFIIAGIIIFVVSSDFFHNFIFRGIKFILSARIFPTVIYFFLYLFFVLFYIFIAFIYFVSLFFFFICIAILIIKIDS